MKLQFLGATREVMLAYSAYLQEKEAEWQNRDRGGARRERVEPLYARDDAAWTQGSFRALEYRSPQEITDGVRVTLHDAGHILGSAIAELEVTENGHTRRIVFNGDLGHRGAPILRDPAMPSRADLVVMESTYGDRLHRSWQDA